jgi:hypothetical protein
MQTADRGASVSSQTIDAPESRLVGAAAEPPRNNAGAPSRITKPRRDTTGSRQLLAVLEPRFCRPLRLRPAIDMQPSRGWRSLTGPSDLDRTDPPARRWLFIPAFKSPCVALSAGTSNSQEER